jgi:hypothetical protein
MNPDPFEQRLTRQPLRHVPAEWRDEILASSPIPQTPDPIPHPLPWWHEWLWPCPQAWAALAAVWVLLLAVNFATRDQTTPNIRSANALPMMPYAWREQQKLLAELFPPEPAAPPRPRAQPAPVVPSAPRSELRPNARREEEIA